MRDLAFFQALSRV